MRDNFFTQFFQRLEKSLVFYSIRMGLSRTIPIVLIGSFVSLFQYFNGKILVLFPNDFFLYFRNALSVLYTATTGMLSVYIVFFVSLSYIDRCHDDAVYNLGAPLASLAGFIVLNGGLGASFDIAGLGYAGTFTAIFSALLASALYRHLSKLLNRKYHFPNGLDINTGNLLSCILPLVFIFIFFMSINMVLNLIFHQSTLPEILRLFFDKIFSMMKRPFWRGFCYVLMTNLLWIFGMHGANILGNIQFKYFAIPMNENIVNFSAGSVPHEIFTDVFFNTFVFIGGCGSLLCLLIAIFLVGKRRNNRTLAKTAAFPMIFNMNEMMIFGLPIVFNPYLLIPFIITPLLFMITSLLAISIGLVPVTINRVEWTIPVFFSGYMATGSITGSILQLVNIVLGVLIYIPFFRLYERVQFDNSKKQINELISYVKECEANNTAYQLISESCLHNEISKQLSNDLRISLTKGDIEIYYQPQFNTLNECVGTEALLRWYHPVYGLIYPPLVIKIAEESNLLYSLETYIFETVAKQQQQFEFNNLKNLKFSANICVNTLLNPDFEIFLRDLKEKYKIKNGLFCIEVTEQIELHFDEHTKEILKKIHDMGYLLAIDDFSMGNTSLKYLESNQFDIVKLDGNLVQNLLQNHSSKEIISSIMYLSSSLGFSVLAEFVETEQQRDALENVGCMYYQGYLYGKAVPFEDFSDFTLI